MEELGTAEPVLRGVAAPTTDETRVLVALADRLAMVDLTTGEHEPLVKFPHAREGMRANDGAVDPAGRFWIGTMAEDEAPDLAALYRLEPDGSLTMVLDGVSLSNGLGWAAGEQRMYYVDSPTKRIDVLDCYGPGGTLDAALEVPADNVTACSFGGEDGRRLFITTARSPQELGGSLFEADPGIAGPPAALFAG